METKELSIDLFPKAANKNESSRKDDNPPRPSTQSSAIADVIRDQMRDLPEKVRSNS